MTHDSVTDVGKAALWVGFFGMFLPTMYFMYCVYRAKNAGQSFYFETLTMTITGIASIAYLTMATEQGYEGGDDGDRQFFFVRYIDWTLTTPLMLLDIAGLARVTRSDGLGLLLGSDVLMIVAGVIGANMNDSNGDYKHYKWAFFALGMLFYMPICHFLLMETGEGKSKAAALSRTVGLFTLLLWSAYPVVWIVAEGSEVISPDVEAIAYTVLDILAKSVFGVMIVTAREAIEEASRDENAPLVLGNGDDEEN